MGNCSLNSPVKEEQLTRTVVYVLFGMVHATATGGFGALANEGSCSPAEQTKRI